MMTKNAVKICAVLPMTRSMLGTVLGLDADEVDRAVKELIDNRAAREHRCTSTGRTYIVARYRSQTSEIDHASSLRRINDRRAA